MYRIKDEIFCFAHLRWCHNGCASNILSGGCRQLKYWMPIHYDTIEDGQNKTKNLIFLSFIFSNFFIFIPFLSYDCVIFAFHRWDLFVKNIITSFHWLHLNDYIRRENKYFNPRNQNHRVAFVTCVNLVCVQMRHAIRSVQCVKYATTPRDCWTRYPSRSSNGWVEFWPEPMEFLVDMLNHAH